ncbi:hypothetical protein C0995_010024 [Termitomyces sp. Mi166|nr:hypothetical protein C0995_010024 [Termitomyces sp. Mi166\
MKAAKGGGRTEGGKTSGVEGKVSSGGDTKDVEADDEDGVVNGAEAQDFEETVPLDAGEKSTSVVVDSSEDSGDESPPTVTGVERSENEDCRSDNAGKLSLDVLHMNLAGIHGSKYTVFFSGRGKKLKTRKVDVFQVGMSCGVDEPKQ